jgi:hypothetical protein
LDESGCWQGGIVATLPSIELDKNIKWNYCSNGLTRDELLYQDSPPWNSYFIELSFDFAPYQHGQGTPLQGHVHFFETRNPSCLIT